MNKSNTDNNGGKLPRLRNKIFNCYRVRKCIVRHQCNIYALQYRSMLPKHEHMKNHWDCVLQRRCKFLVFKIRFEKIRKSDVHLQTVIFETFLATRTLYYHRKSSSKHLDWLQLHMTADLTWNPNTNLSSRLYASFMSLLYFMSLSKQTRSGYKCIYKKM